MTETRVEKAAIELVEYYENEHGCKSLKDYKCDYIRAVADCVIKKKVAEEMGLSDLLTDTQPTNAPGIESLRKAYEKDLGVYVAIIEKLQKQLEDTRCKCGDKQEGISIPLGIFSGKKDS